MAKMQNEVRKFMRIFGIIHQNCCFCGNTEGGLFISKSPQKELIEGYLIWVVKERFFCSKALIIH